LSTSTKNNPKLGYGKGLEHDIVYVARQLRIRLPRLVSHLSNEELLVYVADCWPLIEKLYDPTQSRRTTYWYHVVWGKLRREIANNIRRRAAERHYALHQKARMERATVEGVEEVDVKDYMEAFAKRLTPRQAEVFELLVQGFKQIEIAEMLEISRQAVGKHYQNIVAKGLTYDNAR
jgi:RNA polymerase sigma factor (sigma-70 family)